MRETPNRFPGENTGSSEAPLMGPSFPARLDRGTGEGVSGSAVGAVAGEKGRWVTHFRRRSTKSPPQSEEGGFTVKLVSCFAGVLPEPG